MKLTHTAEESWHVLWGLWPQQSEEDFHLHQCPPCSPELFVNVWTFDFVNESMFWHKTDHLTRPKNIQLLFESIKGALLPLLTLKYELQKLNVDPRGCIASVFRKETQYVDSLPFCGKLDWRVPHIVSSDVRVHPVEIEILAAFQDNNHYHPCSSRSWMKSILPSRTASRRTLP